MLTDDPDLYQAFADALATDLAVPEALGLMARIPGAPAAFARRLTGVEDDAGLAAAALRSGLASTAETTLLREARSRAELVATLRAMALRRRVRRDRAAAIRDGLTAPVTLLLLSAVLDPIATLISGGSYFGAFFRGLVVVAGVVGVATVAGPAALGDARVGPTLLRALCRFPPTSALVARHAEAEVALAIAPIATSLDLDARALRAIAGATPWATSSAARDPATSLPTGVALALLPTPASAPEARLLAHAASAASIATAGARTWVRWGAYVVVFVVAARSIVGLVGGRLASSTGGFGISPDERKELEEIERQIHTPIVTP